MSMPRLVFALLIALPLAAAIQEPIAVDGGLISGVPGWGWGVREYLGIPFAAPPVGNLRWKEPQPVVPWHGVRVADRFGASCMQKEFPPERGAWNGLDDGRTRGLIRVSEDCLYLNVWSPAASGNEKLPVMVWIYGGGGINGSSAEPFFDGNAMAKKGVVVVSMNYRVNVFGWFAHPELSKESPHRVSGNYGSLDQLAALKWVRNNIAKFGGDPDKVTIWGESGGSRSVNFLTASPLLKGYARAAIAESHTTFGRMRSLAEGEADGVALAKSAAKNSLAELRAMSSEELLAAFEKNAQGLTAATVDGWFLPADISTIYSQGKQTDIPLMTGVTNDEGGNLVAAGAAGNPRGTPAPRTLGSYTEWMRNNFGPYAEKLLKLYPAHNDADAIRAYHDIYRDINFVGHRTWAKLQATTGKAPVYIYNFSHMPPHPQGNGNNPAPQIGAVHFSEVIYVFNNLRMRDLPFTAVDHMIADKMSAWWSNFAKNLNPNGPGLENWAPYNAKDELWFKIDANSKMERFNSAGVDVLAAIQEELRRKH
jgi:para-nitrobenzyl esterase